jgi:hypothetical protein
VGAGRAGGVRGTLAPDRGGAMRRVKTRDEREKELQALLATPEGQEGLERLAARYQSEGGGHRPGRASVITYILVYERDKGLVVG